MNISRYMRETGEDQGISTARSKRRKPNKRSALTRAASRDNYCGLSYAVVVGPMPFRMSYYEKFGRFFADIHNNHNVDRMRDAVRAYYTDDATFVFKHCGRLGRPNPLALPEVVELAGREGRHEGYLAHFAQFVAKVPDACYRVVDSRSCALSDSVVMEIFKVVLAGSAVLTIPVPADRLSALPAECWTMDQVVAAKEAVRVMTLAEESRFPNLLADRAARGAGAGTRRTSAEYLLSLIDKRRRPSHEDEDEDAAMLGLVGSAAQRFIDPSALRLMLDSRAGEEVDCDGRLNTCALAALDLRDPALLALLASGKVVYQTVTVRVHICSYIKTHFQVCQDNRVSLIEYFYHDLSG